MSWVIFKGEVVAHDHSVYLSTAATDRTVQNCVNGAALVVYRNKLNAAIACMWGTLYRDG